MDLENLTALQEKLAKMIEIPEGGYKVKDGDVILGLDIQYDGDKLAHIAGNLSIWNGEQIGTYAGVAEANEPYVPSYFCFREGPPLLAFIHALFKKDLPKPNVLLIDGHGLAHPRKFGVACWLGLATELPSIGAAKKTLLKYEGELSKPKGSRLPVQLQKETVGYVLRRQDNVNPIYVSAGHLVNLENATELVLDLPSKFKIPDPIRKADRAARERSLGQSSSEWLDLGKLELTKAPWEKDLLL